MKYQANLLKTILLRYLFPVRLFQTIALSALAIVTIADTRAYQEKQAAIESRSVAAPKRAVKSRSLKAADHRAAERRLADMGYWTGRVDGQWDVASRNALIAFQKVERLKPTGSLTAASYEALLAASRPEPLEKGEAHIEVDLIRQVLFVVDGEGAVTKILPVSTGSGKPFKSQGWIRDAITHPGRYQVRQKVPGWKKSPLGRMYYPVYFMYGTAIHGYSSVPTRPASHGCVRIPMFAARPFFKMIPVGMPVIVHRGEAPPPLPILPSALPSD